MNVHTTLITCANALLTRRASADHNFATSRNTKTPALPQPALTGSPRILAALNSTAAPHAATRRIDAAHGTHNPISILSANMNRIYSTLSWPGTRRATYGAGIDAAAAIACTFIKHMRDICRRYVCLSPLKPCNSRTLAASRRRSQLPSFS